MSINYVRFQRGTKAAYDLLKESGRLDNNTLYFIYDDNDGTGSLYMGNRIISGGSITIASATLDDLADVVVSEANTNSFLVKDQSGNWIAKSLEDVIDLIQSGLNNSGSTTQIFQVDTITNEEHSNAIDRITADVLISKGDITIVRDFIANDKYQHTAYIFDGLNWIPMDGNYSATNVFTPEDIQVTTSVGELAANTVISAGTSFSDLLIKILSQSKDPIKTEPTITSFSVTNNGNGTSFEAGSAITPKWAATFNPGAYTYKSSVSNENIIPVSGTGVSVDSWQVTQNNVEIGTTKDGIANTFILEDSTVDFKIIANYTDGNFALTNLNKLPTTEVRILASNAEKTASITSYRKMFAGGITSDEVNSTIIRSLETNTKASTSEFEFKAKVGDTKLIFAYPADLTTKTPKFEYFTMAWESVGGFTKLGTIQVADARGASNGLKDYIVYTYTPAAAYAANTKYRVSF